MNALKDYLNLPFKIYIIALSTLINRVGSFVGPFLTLILSEQMGMDKFTTGIFVSMNIVASFLGTLIGGRIVDTIGSKYTRVIFHGIHGLLYIICVWIDSAYIIIGLLILSSFSTGIQAPTASALAFEHAPKEKIRDAFSLNYIALNLGFSIGPLLAGFLYKKHMHWLFLGDGISSILSIIIIYIFIPHHAPTKKTETKDKKNLFQLLTSSREITILIIVNALYFIAFSQMNYGMPLSAKHIFGEVGIQLYALLMAINGIMCFALTPMITIISKKYSARQVIIACGILYALGFGLFGYTNIMFFFVIATVIWTTGEILGSITFDGYIMQNCPENLRGRVASLPPLSRRMGMIIGPILAGYVNLHFGLSVMWTSVMFFPLLGAWIIYNNITN